MNFKINLKTYLSYIFDYLPAWFVYSAGALVTFGIFVRAQGLGYSNFQGDEVNTVTFLYGMDQGVLAYLLEQKRGPIQYLLNIINVGIFGYHDEFWIRVPYLLFGIFALGTVFFMNRRIFGNLTAFFGLLLMSVNGLFIAFARITQYQSLMYFVIPIAIFIFISAFEKEFISYKKLAIAGLLTSFSLLVHYDTMSVMPFFISGFVAMAYRGNLGFKASIQKYYKAILLFFILVFVPALSYYIPFYNQSAFEDTTSGYLQGRLFGGSVDGGLQGVLNLFMPGTALSLKLLRLYLPQEFIFLFFVLGFLGILVSGIIAFKKRIISILYLISVLVLFGFSWLSLYPIKPRASSLLVIFSAIAISALLVFNKRIDWKRAAIITWFLGAYSFYFFIMRDARTHVYVSMIPLFGIAGYGFVYLNNFYRSLNLVVRHLFLVSTLMLFVFVSGINYVAFANKNPEYPWWDKSFGTYELYKIDRVRHKKIEGVFGFNNNRGWDEVSELFQKGCLVGNFNSNEKNSITYFYTKFDQKKLDAWELSFDSDNIILVEGPHSWMYYKQDQIPSDYVLVKTIYREDYPVSYIYGKNTLYPEGQMLCK